MRIFIFIVCVTMLTGSGIAQKNLKQDLVGNFEPANLRLQEFSTSTPTKSVTLAVVLSLIVPGTGEWYAGNFDSGKYFLIADGAFWLTYAGFEHRGDWLREDARSFGATHANANFSNKDDQYFVNVGSYLSRDDYNLARLRDRRYDQLYTVQEYHWQWNSDANRLRFRDLRVQSDRMYENAKFAIGALVINRLVSAFSAGRTAARVNASYSARGGWRLGATTRGGFQDAHGIELRITREF